MAATDGVCTSMKTTGTGPRLNPRDRRRPGGGSDITSSPSVRCDWASVPRYWSRFWTDLDVVDDEVELAVGQHGVDAP